MFCYLINKKRSNFLYNKPADYNPKFFWILMVQDWYKINPASTDCPLGTLNFLYVIDIDILLVKKIKKKMLRFW